MKGVRDEIISEPLDRERATKRAKPSLASIALNESRIKIKNIWAWVVGPVVVLKMKTASRAMVSNARSAGSKRFR